MPDRTPQNRHFTPTVQPIQPDSQPSPASSGKRFFPTTPPADAGTFLLGKAQCVSRLEKAVKEVKRYL